MVLCYWNGIKRRVNECPEKALAIAAIHPINEPFKLADESANGGMTSTQKAQRLLPDGSLPLCPKHFDIYKNDERYRIVMLPIEKVDMSELLYG